MHDYIERGTVTFICAPVDSSYPIKEGVFVVPIGELKNRLIEYGTTD